jgi:hypothetical protein
MLNGLLALTCVSIYAELWLALAWDAYQENKQ